MYTILVNDDDSLIGTVKERIMQRSKLVNSLHFLVNPTYKEVDMQGCSVLMEYILPISREYKSEILDLTVDEEGNPTLYKDMLEYKVKFDTGLTREPGDIEVQLTFMNTILDENGNATQFVRKTSPTTIHITSIAAWSDIIPDSALNAIDQRILKVNEQIKAMNDLGELMAGTKADNIRLTDDKLQLTANGEPIGDEIKITVPSISDGELDGVDDGILDLDNVDVNGDNGNNEESSSGDESENAEFIEL